MSTPGNEDDDDDDDGDSTVIMMEIMPSAMKNILPTTQ